MTSNENKRNFKTEKRGRRVPPKDMRIFVTAASGRREEGHHESTEQKLFSTTLTDLAKGKKRRNRDTRDTGLAKGEKRTRK